MRSVFLLALLACLALASWQSPTRRRLLAKKKKKRMRVRQAVPSIPGIAPGRRRPKIVLGVDIDYPPYAQLVRQQVGGFSPEFAKGLEEVCEIDIVNVQTAWSACWTDGQIGEGLARAELHGCGAYTHTQGQRPRFLEFTHGILQENKPAGLLVRLDQDGNPMVDGNDNLSGKTVVDVVGWAPTADTIDFVTNKCTGAQFEGYNMITPTVDGGGENDRALATLLDGDADAVWLYADQAKSYKDGCDAGDVEGWDCELWSQFGTNFAYVQTGLSNHAANGTTLAISKKGSGLAQLLNPCIQRFMESEDYYDLCEKYQLTADCYPNEYFPVGITPVIPQSSLPTNEQAGPCSTGYCSCPQ